MEPIAKIIVLTILLVVEVSKPYNVVNCRHNKYESNGARNHVTITINGMMIIIPTSSQNLNIQGYK